jgi:hypothetical protein
MEHKALLDPLPGSTVQECRAIREPAELKRKHDAKSAELNVHGVKYFEPDTFFDEYRRKYDEFCRHQQSRNLLRPDPRAGVYRATHWTALRGVRNYLNPFADQFTWSRFAIGTLLGAGLPTMAILQPQAVTHQVSTLLSLSMDQSWMAVIVASYLVAGATVGYLFTGKSFVWAFLLGAVPARVAGSTLGPLYGLLMAWTADVAGRYRNRRAKVI